MIRLEKIRLVNWHVFTDTLLDVGQMTLLAGDNGSGKSTIIDAVQYALVANLSHIKFNAAAADRRTGRNLESYCRGKMGADDLDYIRGASLTHVMLQFRGDEAVFCAGIMVDVPGDGSKEREHPWLCSGVPAHALSVAEDGVMRSPSAFKAMVRDHGGRTFDTKREYSDELAHLLGVFRRNVQFNPYLESLVRAVSFTPMTSVDQFVCNYILDDKPLDISRMKENLENYRVAEKEAQGVRLRIEALDGILELYQRHEDEARRISQQEYLKIRLEYEQAERVLSQQTQRLAQLEEQIAGAQAALALLEQQRHGVSELRMACEIELRGNRNYELRRALEEQIRQLEATRDELSRQVARLDLLRGQCAALLGREPDADAACELQRLAADDEQLVRSSSDLEREVQQLRREHSEYQLEYNELKSGIIRYPVNCERLRDALAAEGIECRVFADLVEVADEAWQNAVEGWLNTQRFSILVDEKDFQRAIVAYRRQGPDVAGVGIPNLEKMRLASEKQKVRPGSLAELVQTDSPQARIYADYMLGDVIRANIDNLKEYSRSVTVDCMRYAGHTASKIQPEVWRRHYLGRQAREERLRFLESEIARLAGLLDAKNLELKTIRQQRELLRRASGALHEMKTLAGAPERERQLVDDIARQSAERDSIDISEVAQLEEKIRHYAAQLAGLEADINALNKKTGSAETLRAQLQDELPGREHDLAVARDCFAQFCRDLSRIDDYEQYYNERITQASPEQILLNYEQALKAGRTRLEKLREDIIRRAGQYNQNFNGSLGGDPGNPVEPRGLRQKYFNTDLPAFEEKIRDARVKAEEQFRSDFISRLYENISGARESMKELNHTLKSISFGRDRYRFDIQQRPERRAEIAVIEKAVQISENRGSLFERLNTEEERAVVDRLFKEILENDLSSPEVRRICDYRTYFQYDIRMTDTSLADEKSGRTGELSLSKVIREKSGGEAQTPYYVAIAASFMRFFRNESNSVRLVLFDEAFNKMDDARIGTIIAFFKAVGLQVITAVPTEKIETISPHVDVTNLVLRYGQRADVRSYRRTDDQASHD